MYVGIPKILNVWSTHRFWIGFFAALGFDPHKIVFSSDTSEEQAREFAKGRGTVDCCYPVKCASGHFGELLARDKPKPLDLVFSPMIHSLPSFMRGHVVDDLSCPRVMAAPENIRAGFRKEGDAFAAKGIKLVAPLVSMADDAVMVHQLHDGLKDAIAGLTMDEVRGAVAAGSAELRAFDVEARRKSLEVLTRCALTDTPCLLVVARPYHMDPGIGHEIEGDLQAHGYPVLWAQYLPLEPDLLEWMFGEEVREGTIRDPLDIRDVWPSSYSANTNEILWGAKFAARMPWIAGVIRLASYECGMDQPTYTPVQQIVERSGTLFFSFQELDSTKPAGAVKIRVETIAHYLGRYAGEILRKKQAVAAPNCPLLAR
ncbi:MAG: acyl-CoA dehydratase activase-related protein [Myxococcota bacterium]